MHRPQSTAESTPPLQLWLRTHGRQALLLAALYFLFGHASFLVRVDDVLVTPVLFAPEGIALAMALRFGAAVWPGVFAGQLALALSRGLAPWPAASISVINSLEAVLAVWLFRSLKLDAGLPRARDLAGLLLLVFFVLQPFSATFGNATLWAAGIVDSAELSSSWLNWWIGNSFGQMLVTPLLLALLAGGRTKLQTAGDFLVPVLAISPVVWIADFLLRSTGVSSLLVVLAPILVLLALYRGLVAVCVGALAIAVSALYATSHAFGPFVVDGQANIPDLNLFIIGLALSGQFLAAFLRQTKEQQKISDELRDVRERLQRTAYELTENIPVGTYVLEFDEAGAPRFTFVSERWLKMLDLRREGVLADHTLAVSAVHPDEREEFNRLNAEVYAENKRFFWEGRIVVHGETRWVTIESIPRARPGGGTIWEGAMIDITDRKKAEAQLQRVLDNLPIAVAATTLTSPAELTFINAQFTRTFGYTLQDVPTVAMWAEKAYPDATYRREVFREWDAAVFRAIETKGSVESMGFEVTCKDGTKRDIIFRAVVLDDSLLISMTDVTERKRAEQRVIEAHRDMQLTASAARLGFWELDVETGIDHWDEEMARINGIRLADFDGHWEKFVHPDDYDEVMRETRRMLESDHIFGMEYRLRSPNGEVRHVRERGIVTRDENGRALKVNGVLQDITDEKEAAVREKQLEVQYRRDLGTKLKTSLTASVVAHEINQPLSTILLQSNLAFRSEDDAHEALRVIAAEAQRVVVTIDKMKTLLRSVQTKQREIDLSEVVQSALLYNKGLLARNDVELHTMGLGQPCRITGDDEQLQLAITNLVRNAVEAIAEANPQKREIALDLTEQGDTVELVIGDSGPGWPEDGPAEVPLTTTKKAGTGIGLYVVRTAMENHRGEIVFGRSPLGGAEVRLRFPRVKKA